MTYEANKAGVIRSEKKKTREEKQNGLGRRKIGKKSVMEEYVVGTTISFKPQISVQGKNV